MAKKRKPTKADIEAEQAFVKMQKRLDALPKFGAKYATPTKTKKKTKVVRAKLLTENDRRKLELQERLRSARATPSLVSTANSTGSKLPAQYKGELKSREDKARQVKHVVAPIANKMGYGLITNAEHLKTMGRKT